MPLFNGGKYDSYDDLHLEIDQLYKQSVADGGDTPIGTIWFNTVHKCCPSITFRIRGTDLDPSGKNEISEKVHRAANLYYNMFYGKGWYNHDPNIYPGSGFEYVKNLEA